MSHLFLFFIFSVIHSACLPETAPLIGIQLEHSLPLVCQSHGF